MLVGPKQDPSVIMMSSNISSLSIRIDVSYWGGGGGGGGHNYRAVIGGTVDPNKHTWYQLYTMYSILQRSMLCLRVMAVLEPIKVVITNLDKVCCKLHVHVF